MRSWCQSPSSACAQGGEPSACPTGLGACFPRKQALPLLAPSLASQGTSVWLLMSPSSPSVLLLCRRSGPSPDVLLPALVTLGRLHVLSDPLWVPPVSVANPGAWVRWCSRFPGLP